MYKLLLFDFDGVIVNTFEFCYAIRAQFNPGYSRQEYLDRFKGNIYRELATEHPNQPDNETFFRLYEPELQKLSLVPGIAEVIRQAAQHATLYIISSTDSEVISRYLTRYGLREYFAAILGYQASLSKVVKIHQVLGQTGISTQETLFITDTLGDILEAREAGVESAAVVWGYHGEEVLRSGQPKYLVQRPGELGEEINR